MLNDEQQSAADLRSVTGRPPTWNLETFWLGFHSADLNAPDAVAAALGHALSPADVLRQWEAFGYVPGPPTRPGDGPLTVMLSAKDRTRLALEAGRRRVEMPAMCGLVLATVATDGLFAAVLDG